MPLIDTLLWFNLITLILIIPILWYYDIKYREIPLVVWIPVISICGVITTYFYFTGIYPWYLIVISLVMCLIFYGAFKCHFIEGADYLYLCFIALFWVMTPLSGYAHGIMQLVFYPCLIFCMAITAIVILAYNISKGCRLGIVTMMSHYPGGVPFMIPISAAFIMSVMLG